MRLILKNGYGEYQPTACSSADPKVFGKLPPNCILTDIQIHDFLQFPYKPPLHTAGAVSYNAHSGFFPVSGSRLLFLIMLMPLAPSIVGPLFGSSSEIALIQILWTLHVTIFTPLIRLLLFDKNKSSFLSNVFQGSIPLFTLTISLVHPISLVANMLVALFLDTLTM